MKKVAFVIGDDYLDGRVFNPADTRLNRDGCLNHLRRLQPYLLQHNVQLQTYDQLPLAAADAILFENIPSWNRDLLRQASETGKPLLLNASESIIVQPDNNDDRLLESFGKIFTYLDDRVDGQRFIKVNYSFDLPTSLQRTPFAERKLLCSISANKRSRHPGELYSERMRLVRWFASHAPEQLDLYGQGWDQPKRAAGSWLERKILYRGPWRQFFFAPARIYRGSVAEKRPVMSGYRFALCFENAGSLPGYITEKIFDCMMAGCVPVYLGAPNIAEHIPEDSFILHRKGDPVAALLQRLEAVDETEFNAYLDRIEGFLNGPASRSFSIDQFVKTVGGEILASLANT